MSNHLAIATVTATLQQILQSAIGTVVTGATVTMLRPDAAEKVGEPHVNLYLYQVTPNAGSRNTDLPARNAAGQLVSRPHVAMDLHYLLSFYGNEKELESQRLLGRVAQFLHSRPVLPRQAIRETMSSPSFSFLAKSNLADDIEQVKFTPIAMSLEELSKLWSVFFQTPCALSVAYQGSVVLIESEESFQKALPVRERTLFVGPFQQPFIDEIQPAAGSGQPIIVGSRIVIRGQRLGGATTQVRIGSSPPVSPDALSQTEISLELTESPEPGPQFPSGTLRAGVLGVQVIQPVLLGSPPSPHRGVESNVAAFVLHPVIVPPVTVGTVGSQTTVSVQLKPGVGREQRVVLLLNQTGSEAPRSYSILAPPRGASTETITIPLSAVEPASYLVRVQVDGAESPLNTNSEGRYVSPEVTIP